MTLTRLNPEAAPYASVSGTVASGANVEIVPPRGRGMLIFTATGSNAIVTVLSVYYYENRWGKALTSIGSAYYGNATSSNVTLTWGSEYDSNAQHLKVTNSCGSSLTFKVSLIAG